ncbi:FHA domain-containing protein [Thermosynechococcus sp. HN-54]|uniref:FHA domain-containing protein n=1 Tax=Thermosynechococcus sp. HN-54 TaxID=2933959 RepID=UPI00202CBE39|nr:FHA domain-containing protein [Thermosynechococcus sp. HN-54]URR35189.1 FHA domain-containing protein [Thermosynechococcus sp. HN-54]
MLTQYPQLVISTEASTYIVPLTEGNSWVIGRGKDCTIVLADRWASRRHAMIQRLDNDDYYLIDLGSRNGCVLNGQMIQVPTLLKTGDRFVIGKTTLEFRTDEAVSTTPPDAPVALQPTILIIQPPGIQGQIWQELLRSQGLEVIVESGQINSRRIISDLVTLMQRNPDLLLLDSQLETPDIGNLLNWIKATYPKLRSFIIDRYDNHISPMQRQWAVEHGAIDWLPALPDENLTMYGAEIAAHLRRILKALGRNKLEQDKLAVALLNLQLATNDDLPSQLLSEYVNRPPSPPQ